MSKNFADRLLEAVRIKGVPACVGLDPDFSRLPVQIRDDEVGSSSSAVDAISMFCRRVIEVVAPLVPVVKINSAFFERHYWPGVRAYYSLIQEARRAGLLVIGDVKRGDIGHTAGMYARAHLGDPDGEDLAAPDAVTLNGYLGFDSVKPFVEVGAEHGRGVFVLVRTTNESSADVQDFAGADGTTLAEHLAKLVNTWAGQDVLIGQSGYSALGAVVSPKDPQTTGRLRAIMDRCIFLVPGYGAQGAGAEGLAACFKPDGTGALVNASRSIIFAHQQPEYARMYPGQWDKCVEHACRDFVSTLKRVVPAPV